MINARYFPRDSCEIVRPYAATKERVKFDMSFHRG
jgi:hypothetical protein